MLSTAHYRLLHAIALTGLSLGPALASEPQSAQPGGEIPPLRAPAVPLVAHDPYFSVWSFSDTLTEESTRHWTGATQAMCGLTRIDGKPFRFAGTSPDDVPALKQTSVEVLPTRTIYQFEGQGISLGLTFLTPTLPHDLELLSRPVTYLTWTARSTDGQPHDVSVYFDLTGEWCVDKPEQRVTWSQDATDGLLLVRMGTEEQSVLAKKGDNLRIDWGHVYLAVPKSEKSSVAIGLAKIARGRWASGGSLPAEDDRGTPRAVSNNTPVLAAALDFGKVQREPVSRRLLLAYDDVHSIEYFGKHLPAWWRRDGMEAKGILALAEKQYSALDEKCRAFDDELMADLRSVGGEKYARLAALSFRQCLAAHKLVAGEDGRPLYFSKENFSNGCIGTVDVTYPSSPFFLLFNPELLAAQIRPVFDYAASDRWKFPFAPHDLGTYPKANGQVYGGGETSERDQMPVEECGNMLILAAALAHHGRMDEVEAYWPLLTKWAEYLKEKGLDPENQLCTDDFAGHLAHNTNLSLKAIVALGCYARLCEQMDKTPEAAAYRKLAENMSADWQRMAADGDHYRLTFDKPGTWSQKYNLVWDALLGLKLFPPELAQKEVAYYKTVQNRYGLPLDSRKAYTKLDWLVWSATLADDPRDFQAIIAPAYDWANETTSRVPLTDWYDTKTGKQQGFQARSVVGGVYIPLLEDDVTWKKWRERGSKK